MQKDDPINFMQKAVNSKLASSFNSAMQTAENGKALANQVMTNILGGNNSSTM